MRVFFALNRCFSASASCTTGVLADYSTLKRHSSSVVTKLQRRDTINTLLRREQSRQHSSSKQCHGIVVLATTDRHETPCTSQHSLQDGNIKRSKKKRESKHNSNNRSSSTAVFLGPHYLYGYIQNLRWEAAANSISLCLHTEVAHDSRIFPRENIFHEVLILILRGTIVNRTYGTHKNLYISLFFPTIFGPINYGPP